jgi:hypothetical protein
MPFLEIMQEYFRGERAEALWFIVPVGVASLAFATVVFRTQRDGFMWGVGTPFVVLGLVMLVVGMSVGLRTAGQVDGLTTLYQRDVAGLVAQELPRMEQVNRAWPIYLGTWVTFLVLGVGLRFGLHADWAQGLGIALAFFGGVGLMIDGFAERRARPYTAALEQLKAQPAASPQ